MKSVCDCAVYDSCAVKARGGDNTPIGLRDFFFPVRWGCITWESFRKLVEKWSWKILLLLCKKFWNPCIFHNMHFLWAFRRPFRSTSRQIKIAYCHPGMNSQKNMQEVQLKSQQIKWNPKTKVNSHSKNGRKGGTKQGEVWDTNRKHLKWWTSSDPLTKRKINEFIHLWRVWVIKPKI